MLWLVWLCLLTDNIGVRPWDGSSALTQTRTITRSIRRWMHAPTHVHMHTPLDTNWGLGRHFTKSLWANNWHLLKMLFFNYNSNDTTRSPIFAWNQSSVVVTCAKLWPVLSDHSDWGLYSLSGRTSHCKISWSLEPARLHVKIIVLLWNSTGISAVLLPRCLSNFRTIGKI